MAKILIVGGGVSGLSAGIYAQLNGLEATVCESRGTAGGNLTGWRRGDYFIDNCVHWLTGTHPETETYRMWRDLGALGDGETVQTESLYTCEQNGRRLSLWRDLSRLEADLLARSPRDEREIRSLLSAVRGVIRFLGIRKTDSGEPVGRFALLRAVPALLRYHRLSVGDLADRFYDPLIRSFLSGFLGDDFASLALIAVMATYCSGNGDLPRGGSLAMSERMAGRLTDLGGKLLLGKTVSEISCENGRAVAALCADGERLEADYVILTADPAVLFPRLLRRPVPRSVAKFGAKAGVGRFSAWHCAFACDLSALPFRGEYVLPLSPADCAETGSDRMILREFSHEPSFAPRGKTVLQTMVFCNEPAARAFIALRETPDVYREYKQQLGRTAERLIAERFPTLAGRLTCLDVWTPATYRRYTSSEIGSFMGYALPPRIIPRRLPNRVPGLRNVVLATQWLHAPGGLPFAAESGMQAVLTVLRAEQRQKRVPAEEQPYRPETVSP